MGHDGLVRAGMLVEDDGPHPMPIEPNGSGLLVHGLWGTSDEIAIEEGPVAPQETTASEPASRRTARGHSRRTPGTRQLPSPVPFRGRHVRAVPAAGCWQDLAWAATFRAAALRGQELSRGKLALAPRVDDLRRKQRVYRPGRLLLFVVDISGSMGGKLTTLAKHVALAVLRDAYIRRDRVAMIAFRERTAELLFGPTNQVELVRRGFDTLPCGGTTPLGMGLELAHVVLRRTMARDAGRRPTLILVSDGRANVGSQPGYAAVIAEVEAATRTLSQMSNLSIVFLDTTEEGKNDGPARHIVELLGARRIILARVLESGDDPAAALSRLLQ